MPAPWTAGLDGPLLDTLFARSPLATAFHDRSLRVVYVSPAMAALGCAPASEYVGRRLAESLPAIGGALAPFLQHVVDTGAVLSDLAVGDGTRHWSASCHPLRGPGGDIGGVCSVLHDDTERFETERHLHDREERYRALVELGPDGIAILEDDTIVYVNPAGARILGGRDAADVVHRSVSDFVPPDVVARSTDAIWSSARDRGDGPHDVRIVRLDGAEAVLSVRSVSVDRGLGHSVQTIFRDVTRRRAEERMRDQASAAHEVERTLLQAILRELPVGVVVIDRHGKLILANEASERIWGVRFGPLPPPLQPWSEDAESPNDDPAANHPLRLLRALEELGEMDVAPEIVCGDGAVRRLRGSVTTITSADGTTRGALATFWDVTALARAQDELRRAHEVLEARVAERTARIAEANERVRTEASEREAAQRELHLAARLASIGTLAAGVAHEINNPLAAIVATAELARAMNADGASVPEVDAALARIVDEAHRGGDIVKGLLRLGRSDGGERWPVEVNELVRRVTDSSRVRTVLAASRLRTRFARRSLRVVIDPTELEQLVLNLIQNAVQAGATEITVRTADHPGWARIVVRDDGHGIEPGDLEHIFDPFFTTRGNDGGTGLGLSIVHGIVTRCDGRIAVESRVGRGARFVVDLPVGVRPRTPS